MLPGILLGWLAAPPPNALIASAWILIAFIATIMICSSNYTLNEILDAPTDREHPEKNQRPAAAGRIESSWAYAQWILLGIFGLTLAWFVGRAFFFTQLALLLGGVVYNVHPIRSKDLPYLDVLSESLNNPLRLLLGWFAVKCPLPPPASLILSYWMLGAYFMAIKRFAELRHINDRQTSMAYRKSFAYYTQHRLLISIMFYATAFAFFSGIFLIRYHFELILCVPIFAGFMAFYLYLGLLPDSPTQHPESLYKQKGFMIYTCFTGLTTIGCFFLNLPWLRGLFNARLPGGF